jgi:hypothetical protein
VCPEALLVRRSFSGGGAKWYNLDMNKDFIDEHIDDNVHSNHIESNLDQALHEQTQMKRLVDLFMLALILIFAVYSFF